MHSRFLLALAAALVLSGCVTNMAELKDELGVEQQVAPPLAPSAKAAATPTLAQAGEVVRFTAAATVDPQGAALSYVWSFGDGAGDTGVEVAHAYVEPGSYSVTLTVTNARGVADVDLVRVEVLPVDPAPVARASATPARAWVGEPVAFDGGASFDAQQQPLRWLWDFGDGATAATARAAHTFSDAGVRIVTLTVVDAVGQEATAAVRVPVSLATNRTGVLDATASRADVSLAVGSSPSVLRLALTYEGAPASDVRIEVRDAAGRVVDFSPAPGPQVVAGATTLILEDPEGAYGLWTVSVVKHGGVRVPWALDVRLEYA